MREWLARCSGRCVVLTDGGLFRGVAGSRPDGEAMP